MSFFKRLLRKLLFTIDASDEDKARIRNQRMRDNRRFVIVWSSVLTVYWIFCLVLSLRAYDFMLCRKAYIVGLLLSIPSLLTAVLISDKDDRLIRAAAFLTDASALVTGIGIACYQDSRTIVIFASVLIVPVMFISDTLSTLCLLTINVLIFIIAGAQVMSSEPYFWSLMNIIIFSSLGLLVGYFVNKARFERYVYACDAEKLAEVRMMYAYYDQMTGLKNRRAYAERLQQLSESLSDDLCIIMADINGLKKINDTLGHEAGDELIISAAECLRQAFGSTEDIYRIGGDEFCVIMENGKDDAQKCIDRLDALSAEKKGKYIDRVSISCGLGSGSNHSDIEEIAQEADRRMYESKNQYYLVSGQDRRKH